MKKIAFATISISFLLIFTGCAWKVPEKVSVKTNAEYNFSLGTFEKQLDSEMDIVSMLGETGKDNDAINTYDYFPGKEDKNVQHFILDIEVVNKTGANALISAADAEAAFTLAGTDSLTVGSGLTIANITGNPVKLEFNPSVMMNALKDALGSDVAGKISFESVPMYLYCEAPKGINATAELKLFYANKDDPTVNKCGEKTILDMDNSVNPDYARLNCPKPEYEFEDTVLITNLDKKACLSKTNITNLLNKKDDSGNALSSVTDNDSLYISYNITNFQGTVEKEETTNGVGIIIYAIVDLPFSFIVDEDLTMDLNEMSKDDSSSSSSSNTPAENSEKKDDDDEFAKIIDAIDTITIRYITYSLPFYAQTGMQLGFDLVGNNQYQYGSINIVDKEKKIKESDKSVIQLYQTTILAMKENANFSPNIQLKMAKDTIFSVPRVKAVEMNIEMGIKTDGIVKVK